MPHIWSDWPTVRSLMDLNAKVRQVLSNVTCHGDFGILRALLGHGAAEVRSSKPNILVWKRGAERVCFCVDMAGVRGVAGRHPGCDGRWTVKARRRVAGGLRVSSKTALVKRGRQ
jgi:hypothetical protein